MSGAKRFDGSGIVRVIALIIAVPAGVVTMLGMYFVVNAQLATTPADDPHGYDLVFGVAMAFCAGLVFVALVPFTLPKRLQRRGLAIAVGTLVLGALLAGVIGQLGDHRGGTDPGPPSPVTIPAR